MGNERSWGENARASKGAVGGPLSFARMRVRWERGWESKRNRERPFTVDPFTWTVSLCLIAVLLSLGGGLYEGRIREEGERVVQGGGKCRAFLPRTRKPRDAKHIVPRKHLVSLERFSAA